MDHILHLVCIWGQYFLACHTHVLCMGSGSASALFLAPGLVHSLLKYFFKFQLWYWIQLYTTKYSNLILIFRYILVWIFGSTYRKGEILKQKWHVNSQFFTVTRDTHWSRNVTVHTYTVLVSGPYNHMDHILHSVCIECVIFWHPIHMCYQAVLCRFSGTEISALSLLNFFFFYFSCDIEFKFVTKYSNLILIYSDISLDFW